MSNTTEISRRRPRIPKSDQAYRAVVNRIWGNHPTRILALPTAAVDYNLFMGGVDIADQRRSYFTTQVRVARTWFPLFFWLLDTSIINAFLIAQGHIGGRKDTLYTSQRQFHKSIA